MNSDVSVQSKPWRGHPARSLQEGRAYGCGRDARATSRSIRFHGFGADASQFRVFRILFGIYLTIHFAMLVPYANELFGAAGILADPALNPAHGLFPNPLNFALPASWVTVVLAFLTLLSVLFTFDIARPVVAILLWLGWTALFHRNNLIANPSIPYIGLLLVLCALVPTGKSWTMPRWIPRCAWILLAVGYTFSGITKLGSPSWIDGSAIALLLENPLARPGIFRDALLAMPDLIPQLLTWGTLGIEILFAPLVLSRRLRPWVWLATCAMHLGIIAVVDFADLSLGMLMIHAFTFDRRWLEACHLHLRTPRLAPSLRPEIHSVAKIINFQNPPKSSCIPAAPSIDLPPARTTGHHTVKGR